ncbi:MAG: hypothetical protein AAGD11_03240 [Planctomycetota bacterium]
MPRKLIALLLAVVATCGCCACDNSCDYLPPVLDGPYSACGCRTGIPMTDSHSTPAPVEAEGEPITPLEPAIAPEAAE